MEWFQRGQVAIVTGGSRGLGRALARELLGRGPTVIIDGRDRSELERARQELSQLGELVAIPGDVGNSDHVHALVDAARRLGRLDLLINNASTLGKVPLPVVGDIDRDTFRSLFDVNVFAPIHLSRHALELMGRSAVSTIVNITSDAAVEPYPSWGGYGATKAALEHLSRVLAAELGGTSTRVLVFDPGDMNTAMHRDAVPDADASQLRDPADSARALLRTIPAMSTPFARVRASDVRPIHSGEGA